VIVSTLVLHLKAAEAVLETSQSTYENNSVEVQKIRMTRCKKTTFYLVLAKIRIKKYG